MELKFWRCCIRRRRGATDRLALWREYLAKPVIDLALIRLAQVPEPYQKRGQVGGVKQRLLAELDAFELTSFDRCVQCSAANTEQLKCLVDRIRYFRKTESRRVDRINSGTLVVAHTRHCALRRSVLMRFARVSHRTHCVTRLGVNEQPKSALCYAMAPPQWAGETVLVSLKRGQPVGQAAMPTALLDDAHDLRDGFRSFGKLAAGGFR